MGNINSSHDPSLVCRPAKSNAPGQPLAGIRGVDDERLAYQGIPATTRADEAPHRPSDLGGIDQTGDGQHHGGGFHSRTGDLGALDQVTSQAAHEVSVPRPSIEVLVCVNDLVAMMNAGGHGHIIGERQLHRHRIRADRSFEVRMGRGLRGIRIDVLRYIAWLTDQVHGDAKAPVTGEVTYAGVFALLERQAYRCALSGRILAPDTSSLDHILPVSRGGPHRLENAQVLHVEINRAKAALTNAEFIALCREVVAWADCSTSNAN